MQGPFNRWSQIVRRPGAVEVYAHHPTQVPALGDTLPYSEPRDGLRLLVNQLEGDTPIATIDITSTAAMAMLEGFLANGAMIGKRLAWRSGGSGKFRRDTIHIKPRVIG
jgi:hypothetical protein